MNKTKKQKYPKGWNEKKVRELIDYYDNQSEDEGAAEIESAPEAEAWMPVPAALVAQIDRLIADYHARAANGRVSNKGPKKIAKPIRRR